MKLKGLRSDPEFQPVLSICSIVSNSPICGRPAPARVLIYCGDYRCSHSVVLDGSRWSDGMGPSDLEHLCLSQTYWLAVDRESGDADL